MNVEDLVQQRIEAARRREADRKRQRAELAAARAAGLPRRHAAKLHRLHGADDHADVAQTATTAPSRGDTATTANPPKETPMPTPFRAVHCPGCRAQRTVRRVGTAAVTGSMYEIVRCPQSGCGLQWLVRPEQPRTTPIAA